MTDADTKAAVDALAYRIRERDAAIRSGDDVADADVMALEFITKFRAQGWRVTAAKVYQLPRQATDDRTDGPPDDYRAARAEWEARSHPHRSRDDAGGAA
jgi:hypothetical protein